MQRDQSPIPAGFGGSFQRRQGTPGLEAAIACEARITEWRAESGINTYVM